ncbi:MAG: hypothetical protein QF464_05530 [Myxococcota bacterium]|nr:hypothetical protein [Myxococcota bacterium]
MRAKLIWVMVLVPLTLLLWATELSARQKAPKIRKAEACKSAVVHVPAWAGNRAWSFVASVCGGFAMLNPDTKQLYATGESLMRRCDALNLGASTYTEITDFGALRFNRSMGRIELPVTLTYNSLEDGPRGDFVMKGTKIKTFISVSGQVYLAVNKKLQPYCSL